MARPWSFRSRRPWSPSRRCRMRLLRLMHLDRGMRTADAMMAGVGAQTMPMEPLVLRHPPVRAPQADTLHRQPPHDPGIDCCSFLRQLWNLRRRSSRNASDGSRDMAWTRDLKKRLAGSSCTVCELPDAFLTSRITPDHCPKQPPKATLSMYKNAETKRKRAITWRRTAYWRILLVIFYGTLAAKRSRYQYTRKVGERSPSSCPEPSRPELIGERRTYEKGNERARTCLDCRGIP
jgi:hypothetical protein